MATAMTTALSTLTSAVYSGKHNVTVWHHPSVCLSVCLSVSLAYSPWLTSGSVQCGDRSFRPNKKEDRLTCYCCYYGHHCHHFRLVPLIISLFWWGCSQNFLSISIFIRATSATCSISAVVSRWALVSLYLTFFLPSVVLELNLLEIVGPHSLQTASPSSHPIISVVALTGTQQPRKITQSTTSFVFPSPDSWRKGLCCLHARWLSEGTDVAGVWRLYGVDCRDYSWVYSCRAFDRDTRPRSSHWASTRPVRSSSPAHLIIPSVSGTSTPASQFHLLT